MFRNGKPLKHCQQSKENVKKLKSHYHQHRNNNRIVKTIMRPCIEREKYERLLVLCKEERVGER